LWIGTPRIAEAGTQAEDGSPDAQHILQLLLENRFPKIGYRAENRDCGNCCGTGIAWQARTRIMNQLASGGPERRSALQKKLWREGGRKQWRRSVGPWASR
jgi:hypothetical protein